MKMFVTDKCLWLNTRSYCRKVGLIKYGITLAWVFVGKH